MLKYLIFDRYSRWRIISSRSTWCPSMHCVTIMSFVASSWKTFRSTRPARSHNSTFSPGPTTEYRAPSKHCWISEGIIAAIVFPLNDRSWSVVKSFVYWILVFGQNQEFWVWIHVCNKCGTWLILFMRCRFGCGGSILSKSDIGWG